MRLLSIVPLVSASTYSDDSSAIPGFLKANEPIFDATKLASKKHAPYPSLRIEHVSSPLLVAVSCYLLPRIAPHSHTFSEQQHRDCLVRHRHWSQ